MAAKKTTGSTTKRSGAGGATATAGRKKPSRLGRGLSSLMNQPVAIAPGSGATRDSEVDAPADSSSNAHEQISGELASGNPSEDASGAGDSSGGTSGGGGLVYVAIDQITPNPHQPRQHFDPAGLKALAESIASEGLMQPIILRPRPHPRKFHLRKGESLGSEGAPAADSGGSAGFGIKTSGGETSGGDASGRDTSGGGYELVAGERRWRAAQLAKLKVIPAIVRALDDRQTAEWALIENLQREDLNPIERAVAFDRLQQQFELSHDQIAQRVGLERSTVTNLLRLLSLSPHCRQLVEDGLLAMGHARAIAGLGDAGMQDQLANKTLREGLSVRKLEQLVKAVQQGDEHGSSSDSPDAGAATGGNGAAASKVVRSAYLADLEQQLGDQLATRVRIRPGRKKGSGTLQIDFFSLQQFDDIIHKLGATAE